MMLDADLHAVRTDDIKSSGHAGDKLDDLAEAVVANTPGTVDEEDQICLGTSAHCVTDTEMMLM